MGQFIGKCFVYFLLPLGLFILGVSGLKDGYSNYQAGKFQTEKSDCVLSDVYVDEDTDSDGDTTYTTYAVLNLDINGENYSTKPDRAKIKGRHREGEIMDIWYNPDDPSSYSLESQPKKVWGMVKSAGLLILGIFWFGMGIYTAINDRKKEKVKEEMIERNEDPGEGVEMDGHVWHKM